MVRELKNTRIAAYQAAALSALTCLGSMVSFTASGQMLGHNMWLAYLAALGGGALLFLLYRGLLQRCPGQSLEAICTGVLGRGGQAVQAFFLFQFIYAFSYCLLALTFFWTSLTMPATPFLLYVAIVTAVTAAASRLGLAALARLAVVLIALLLLVLVLDTLLIAPDMRLERFLPVGQIDARTLLLSAGQFFSVQFGLTPLVLLFLDQVEVGEGARRSRFLLWGWLIAAAYFAVNIFRAVAVLGDTLAVQYYPTGQLLRMLEWNSSLSHLELGGLLVILGVSMIFLILLQYAAGRLWSALSGRRAPIWVIALVEFLLVALLYRLVYSPHDRSLFVLGSGLTAINIVFLLVLFWRSKKKRKKKRINGGGGETIYSHKSVR